MKKNNLSRELSLLFFFRFCENKLQSFLFLRPFLQRIKFLKKQLTKT
jgi:hypothetical protein